MSDLTLEQFNAQLNGLVDRNKRALMVRGVAIVERHTKREAPVGRGDLRRDVTGRIEDGGNRGSISFSLKYGRYVVEGTGLYGPRKTKIIPKTKRALAFSVGGATIVRRSVKGQKPNPFMQRAFIGSRAEVQQQMREWGQQLFQGLG